MTLGRRFPEIALAVAGVLGQAAFYASFGRSFVPVWLRVAVHLAVALPLILVPPAVEPELVTRLPTHVLRQVWVAIAGAAYLILTAGSLALVVRGARMHGLAFFLVLESAGAAAAGVALVQALRFLAGPRGPRPEKLFEPPWAGAYRTRPAVPPALPAPPPPARPVRAPSIVLAMLSVMLTAGGGVLVCAPNHPVDRLLGLIALSIGALVLDLWARTDRRRRR